MDFVVEILFQFVFEVVAEVLLEFEFRKTVRFLRSQIVRAVLSTGAGLAFGLWWGTRLADTSIIERPRLLWVSLAVGVLALGMALRARGVSDPQPEVSRTRRLLDPRVWTDQRWLSLGLLNLGIALGIEIGFNPALR